MLVADMLATGAELGGGAASGAGVRADDGDWVIDTAWRDRGANARGEIRHTVS